MNPDAPIDVPPTLAQDPGVDLLSTYWPAAAGLVVAAVGVVLVVRTVRRRRGRSRRRRILTTAGLSTATALVLVASLALGVNTWVGYFPSAAALSRWVDDKVREPVAATPGSTPGSPLDASGGERVTTADRGHAFQTAVPSSASQVPSTGAWVYVPPDYDKPGNSTRYPVVYLLHGSPGSAADWFAAGRADYTLDTLIADGTIPPMILVSPDLNAGAEDLEDEPLDIPGGPQLETFVTSDVVSWADSGFRTLADAEHRIISGMSSGGLASLLYGLHRPDLFGGVISILPYAHPTTASILANADARRRNSPLDVIAARPGSTDQTVFLGQGDEEPVTEATQILDALRGQGQVTTLRVLPGLGHNWRSARTILPYGLVWTVEQRGWKTG